MSRKNVKIRFLTRRSNLFRNIRMITRRRRSYSFRRGFENFSEDSILLKKPTERSRTRRIPSRLSIPIPKHKCICVGSALEGCVWHDFSRNISYQQTAKTVKSQTDTAALEIRSIAMVPETSQGRAQKPTNLNTIPTLKETSFSSTHFLSKEHLDDEMQKGRPILIRIEPEMHLVNTGIEINTVERKIDDLRPAISALHPTLRKQTALCDEVEYDEPVWVHQDIEEVNSDKIFWEFQQGRAKYLPNTIPKVTITPEFTVEKEEFQPDCNPQIAPVLSEIGQLMGGKNLGLGVYHAFWDEIPLLSNSPSHVSVSELSISDLEPLYDKYKLDKEFLPDISLDGNMNGYGNFRLSEKDLESAKFRLSENKDVRYGSDYENVTPPFRVSDKHAETPSTTGDRQPVERAGILRAECSKSRGRSVGFYEDLKQRQKLSRERRAVNGSTWPESAPEAKLSSTIPMDKPASISSSAKLTKSDEDNEENEEDYSASASAIISRVSAGGRRRVSHRRASSHSPEFGLPSSNRRRSSVFTTSSAETAVSVEEGETSQEQMYENMRLHKEVLNGVRLQPWPMRRKLWLVKQAKLFLSKHEGQLQERLAQSKRTKDLLARFNILVTKQWQNSKRELANLMNYLIPWELRIKEIESHFGSAVASYFTFLRWLFWVNLVISIFLIAFVAVPEVVLTKHVNTGERKKMLPEEEANSTSFETLWNFEGILKYSPLFYGYYSNNMEENANYGYRLPLAYFLTGIGVYTYSFIATLRRMAVNSRQSKLSEKEDECVFTWKLFTGWDYMIGNAETAHNRTSSIVLSFKEALLEEAERKREDLSWKIIVNRILVNLVVIILLVGSAYAVVFVVGRSTLDDKNSSWWRQNEINIVINFISNAFPHMFEILGDLEGYHPRKSLRIHLARIMALNLLNTYTFMFAVFHEISNMTDKLQELKDNLTATITTTTSPPPDAPKYASLKSDGFFLSEPDVFSAEAPQAMSLMEATCHRIPINCSLIARTTGLLVGVSSVLTANISDIFYSNASENALNTSFLGPGIYEADLNLVRSPNTYFTNVSSDEMFLNVSDLDTADSSLYLDNTEWTTTDASVDDDLMTTYIIETFGNASKDPNITEESHDVRQTSTNASNDSFYSSETPFISSNESEAVLNETICYVTVCDGPTLVPPLDTSAVTEHTPTSERTPDQKGEVDSHSNVNITKISETTSQIEKQWTAKPLWTSTEASKIINIGITKEPKDIEKSNESTIQHTHRPTDPPELLTMAPPKATRSDSNVVFTPPASIDGNSTHVPPGDIPSTTVGTTTIQDREWSVQIPRMNESSAHKSESFLNQTSAAALSTTGWRVNESTTETTQRSFAVSGDTHTKKPPASTTATFFGEILASLDSNETESTEEPDAPFSEAVPAGKLDIETRRKLRSLCWETMFGQEIVKLTVGDLVMTILGTILIDFLRALFVRFVNKCWCWDLEKKFPQYGDFKIAENILHLINNQGMVWMGIFFSPGLPLINVIKLIIIMYLRAWAVLTCNVPHEIVFRASRSNNFFFSLLLLMLFLCVLPVGYAIVWVQPSWHCGPFSHHKRMYHIFTFRLKKWLPKKMHHVMDYMASPGIIIPLLMLLVLVIYYLLSLTSALREANNDLKAQLRRERTEERRKMFQIASRRRRGIDDYVDSTLVKWKQILPEVQANTEKVVDDENHSNSCPQQKTIAVKRDATLKRKGTLADIVQQAMTKTTTGTEGQERGHVTDENADSTDVEQQDSLSEDYAKKSDKQRSMGKKKKEKTKKEKTKKEKTKKEKKGNKTEEERLQDSLTNIPKIQISESSSPDSKKLSETSRGGSTETVITTKLQSSESDASGLASGDLEVTPEEVSDPVPAMVSVENELTHGKSEAETEAAGADGGGKSQKSLKFGLFRKHKTTPVSRDPVDQTWSERREKMDARSLSLSQPKSKKKTKSDVKASAASESDLTKEEP